MQNTAAGKPGAARATRPASAQHLWSQVLLKKQGSGSGKGGVWAGLETPIQTLCQPAEEVADAPGAAHKTPQDFLTCRQAVLETLPTTPSTTPWPREPPRPVAFTHFPEKPQSSPECTPNPEHRDTAWTTHHEVPNG